MALQENINREINSLPAMKKKRSQLSMFIALLGNQFAFSKTVPFICGLVASYTFTEYTVVFLLMDYLTYYCDRDLRTASIVTNMQDGLSCLLVVVVSLISEAYTGCFTVIIFCAAVSIMGLTLLWISSITKEFDMVYVAIILLALGRSARSILYEFLKNQLGNEKRQSKKGSKPPEHDNIDIVRTNIWWNSARFVGYIATTGYSVHDFKPTKNFKSAALIMGGAYFFFFGCVWWSHENLTSESHFGKICRICRAAMWKLKLRYPTSENWYYWKHDKREGWYKYGEGIRLLPRVPLLCRWLDKAAIIKDEGGGEESEDCDVQEMKGDLCTVKEVREVKRIAILICLGLTFIAYSLLMASGNIFFVVQTSNLKTFVFKRVNDIPFLFMVKSIMRDISLFFWWCMGFLFGEFKKSQVTGKWVFNLRLKRIAAIIRIGIGMVCAILCCIVAWQVEARRLSKIKNEGILDDASKLVSMTTKALIPQFSLLGITEGLIDGGLTNLFCSIASEPMWTFDESFSQLVMGSGKLLTIPFVIVGTGWFKEDANTSHLDKYYEMLAIMNIVFLGLFILFSYRYAYKQKYPEDEEDTEPGFQHDDQANSEEAQRQDDKLELLEGLYDAEVVTAIQEGLTEATGDTSQGNDKGIQLVIQNVTELFQ